MKADRAQAGCTPRQPARETGDSAQPIQELAQTAGKAWTGLSPPVRLGARARSSRPHPGSRWPSSTIFERGTSKHGVTARPANATRAAAGGNPRAPQLPRDGPFGCEATLAAYRSAAPPRQRPAPARGPPRGGSGPGASGGRCDPARPRRRSGQGAPRRPGSRAAPATPAASTQVLGRRLPERRQPGEN